MICSSVLFKQHNWVPSCFTSLTGSIYPTWSEDVWSWLFLKQMMNVWVNLFTDRAAKALSSRGFAWDQCGHIPWSIIRFWNWSLQKKVTATCLFTLWKFVLSFEKHTYSCQATYVIWSWNFSTRIFERKYIGIFIHHAFLQLSCPFVNLSLYGIAHSFFHPHFAQILLEWPVMKKMDPPNMVPPSPNTSKYIWTPGLSTSE